VCGHVRLRAPIPAHGYVHGTPARLDAQDFMAVLPQARRGLARELLGVEQESDQLVRRDAPQFIARLDVMQRAAVGGQID
jgi:BMFP domain-containing protein YqiC